MSFDITIAHVKNGWVVERYVPASDGHMGTETYVAATWADVLELLSWEPFVSVPLPIREDEWQPPTRFDPKATEAMR